MADDADIAPSPHAGPPPERTAYRVLARKYRPRLFGELIGQAPMVRTLKNAFDADRLAQANEKTGNLDTGIRIIHVGEVGAVSRT